MARRADEIDTEEPTQVKPRAAGTSDGDTTTPEAMRWSTRPPLKEGTHPDGLSVLLRWTEDLDDERAVTLWAGLSAVEDPAAREAALLRWIDWAGVTVPLGTRVRDLVAAVTRLSEELEATARNAERIFSLEPRDLLPVTRALHGWMRAREAQTGVVAGAARAIVLAREVMRARAIDPPAMAAPSAPGERETFEVLPAAPGRGRVSSREVAEASARAPDPLAAGHAMLVSALRRSVERAAVDECAELLSVWLRAEHPTALPPWAASALDFVLLDGDLRGHQPRAIASMARMAPGLWVDLVRGVDAEPRDAVRALRLLTALSQHTDLARDLAGVPAQAAVDALVRALEHPRFSVWSRAARTMGRLAGVMPLAGPRLQALVSAENPSVLRNRACAALGDLSPFASAELRARRAAVLSDKPSIGGTGVVASRIADGELSSDTAVWAVPEAALVAALAVALPDLAVDGTGAWADTARSFIARGAPRRGGPSRARSSRSGSASPRRCRRSRRSGPSCARRARASRARAPTPSGPSGSWPSPRASPRTKTTAPPPRWWPSSRGASVRAPRRRACAPTSTPSPRSSTRWCRRRSRP
ncbi:MAG: hypothetical protein R3A52_17200 [Polyangiales bacterium]